MLQTTYLHSGWEFAEKSWPGGKVATVETGWLPATVPGHVHLDLIENGIIAHPFERMNELGCQWVDGKDWSYRTTFTWTPNEDLPCRVLRFEGLDTVCDIYLNDEKIGSHDNMFMELEIDVASSLKEGENTLRIDFRSAVNVGLERKAAYLEKDGLRPDTIYFEERSFVRKAQYMFGWDWGPRLVSCGIWRPVSLLEFAARIKDVQITQVHQEDGSVSVSVNIEQEGDGEFYAVHGFDPDGEFIEAFAETEPGDPVLITDPYLWDPRNPQLYEITVSLGTANPSSEDEPVKLRDIKTVKVGLVRTVLLQQPDEYGESFEFEVNGTKIWARGANWIPDHSFPAIVTRAQYRDRLEKAKDMGFNMLRVWGGGLYETNEFYELCDELGILVWQDFPFACAYYPDDEAWQQVIKEEASQNIVRLRNHPSLALWCGNNENLEMHINTWGGAEKHPPRYYGANHYDQVLPAVVSELDPKTSYIATSPIGENPNNDGKSEKQKGPNSGGYGDQHCWDVWHGRGDWKFYADSTGRFSSEYGFASSCSTSLWSQILEDQDWDPHSKVVQWHDRTGKGHETFHGYVKLHYPEPVTLEDWVYYSQLNQRDALRFGVEHYRRSEFCRGSLIWQLNDCWPVQSWAILDSEGDYKALAYDLRRLYDDNLISIVRDGETVRIWAMNDGEDAWSTAVVLSATNVATGEVYAEWYEQVELEPDSRSIVLEASIAGLSVPDTLLSVWDEDGSLLAWQLVGEPKAARLAHPETLTISTAEEGVLVIETPTPVIDLMFTEDGSPAPFEDNFVTRTEPGVFSIRVTRVPDSIEARSLAGEHRIKITRSPL